MIAEQSVSTQKTPFCDYADNGFHHDARRADLGSALGACLLAGIEVVSLQPEWVEFRVPCSLAIVSPLEELLTQLDADLPQEISEAINYAFREMLSNAVEYGGRLDPAARETSVITNCFL